MKILIILSTVVLLWKLKNVAGGNTHGQTEHIGPSECSEYMSSNAEVDAFNPYPKNPYIDQNFLTFGEKCSFRRELEFREKLYDAYHAGKSNHLIRNKGNIEGLIAMRTIWERYRRHAVEGVYTGNRVCNQAFLLSCHPSLEQCLCRLDYRISGDLTKQPAHERIDIIETAFYTEIYTDPKFKTYYEIATVCRVREDSVCQWDIPWMAFCFLPCEKGNYCIGDRDEGINTYRCRHCNPWDTEKYPWETCRERMFDENGEEIPFEEEEEEEEDDNLYLVYGNEESNEASITVGQKIIVMVLLLVLFGTNFHS